MLGELDQLRQIAAPNGGRLTASGPESDRDAGVLAVPRRGGFVIEP